MNQDIKQKWIDKLLSGEIVQGHGRLRTVDNKMCCLGVLCELYREETGNGEWILDGDHYTFSPPGGFLGESNYPPESVWKWAGLKSASPGDKDGIPLALHNDGDRGRDIEPLNFVSIANIIKEDL